MKVLVTLPLSFKKYAGKIKDPLTNNGCSVVFEFFDTPPPKEKLIRLAGDATIYVSGSNEKVDREIIESASHLQVVMRFGAGYNNVDLFSARKENIYVTNVPGQNADSVAELTVGLILTLARKISLLHQHMREGCWNLIVGEEIKGKTLGVIGLGSIGRCVVEKIQGFKMRIVGCDVNWDSIFSEKWGVKQVSLENLLKVSNYITVHVPLNKKTRNLISYKEFSLMRKGVYLINTSRGGVVNEDALIEALESKRIGGAALDVFSAEPLTRSKLQKLDNVVLTPHIGGSTKEAIERVTRITVENILRVREGKRPLYIVNDY